MSLETDARCSWAAIPRRTHWRLALSIARTCGVTLSWTASCARWVRNCSRPFPMPNRTLSVSTSPRKSCSRDQTADIVERHVSSPVLQAAVATDGTIGTFAGPRDAGTGYVLAHHYAGRALGVQGAWGYVRGGMGAISQALASAAAHYGATILRSTAVEKIEVDAGGATGVLLHDGTRIGARVVVSNAHPRTTFFDLAGEEHLAPPFAEKIHAWKTTGASFKLNLALGELPQFKCRPGRGVQPHHHATIHISSIDRLSSRRVRGRQRERDFETADARMFPADSQRSIARAGGQTHSFDLCAILRVRSR